MRLRHKQADYCSHPEPKYSDEILIMVMHEPKEAFMAQKLVTTFTLLLFLLMIIVMLSAQDSQPVQLDELVYLPIISRIIS
jgi:hypothetical protein